MLNTVIIDDEPDAISYLRSLIREYCPNLQLAGTAQSVCEGIDVINRMHPDLLFLDIEMPDGSGFDLLRSLKIKDFEVIFTTAYNQYAIEAFKVCAVDYLLKPISIDEFIKAIYKAEESVEQKSRPDLNFLLENYFGNKSLKLCISTIKGYEYIELKDIVRIEAEGSYSIISLMNNRKIMVSKAINEYDRMLNANMFFRTHHSHLINIEHVKKYIKIDGGYIEMSDGSSVPISRRRKVCFLEKMNQIMVI